MSQETFQNIINNVYKIRSITIENRTKNQMCKQNTKRTTQGRLNSFDEND